MNHSQEQLKYLFQQEFSKLIAVISKMYGLHHIEIAEDIVCDTFLAATETLAKQELPPNPVAWLYKVAKQKATYHFRRHKIFEEKVLPQVIAANDIILPITELDFAEQNIKDSQLQMLFAICHPSIGSEGQIGLALRILCGFGVDEIAEAFLSSKETINKRLFRAKEKLRSENIKMEVPNEHQIGKRLDNVLHIIYLLFNEGYYSKTQNQILQKDLCLEALRLGIMLIENETTNLPKTNALISLMCFHSSRFAARQPSEDLYIVYEQQDEELWDKALINQGLHFLMLSAKGNKITSYHLEAKIAYTHCIKEDSPEKWEGILQLYNQLLTINYSPSVALNRTFAVYKANGAKQAIAEAEKLKLDNNHFYFLLLGELYKNIDKNKAQNSFQKAYSLSKTQTEKQNIQKKIDQLNKVILQTQLN